MRAKSFFTLAAASLCLLAACGEDDPEAQSPNNGGGGGEEACNPNAGLTVQDNATCTAAADDYTPRDSGSANDTWDACISDDNTYHQIEASISTIQRVGAFEQIATLLAFDGSRVPTAQDFLDARVVYLEEEGLESRLVRREDEHYPKASDECRNLSETELAQNADRCVGPAKMVPMLNEAFKEGSEGTDLVANAARIEATLLWFLYVSTHKEATTCAKTPKDCDSSYAYYTGGEARSGGLGLSKYVKARSPQAHDRVWDGILAVRCWRDLDNPTGEAQDLTMQAQAIEQLDTALLRGMALIVRQRLDNLDCAWAWESIKILGPVLDRAATERDATAAATLRTEFAKTDPAQVDVAAATAALDSLFPCP